VNNRRRQHQGLNIVLATAIDKTSIPAEIQNRDARAMSQRLANERAAAEKRVLSFPNPWDAIDFTKVSRAASAREIHASYVAFGALRQPRPRKQHQF
jgi:hypothetical protein